MRDVLALLADRIERGKVNREFPHPAELKGEDGAAELCVQAIEAGIAPDEIISQGLVRGMRKIGEEYEAGRAFIPELILAGKAMPAALAHLGAENTASGAGKAGTVVLGTVAGDVHDIGKNVVKMVLTGEGFAVVDLGVDVETESFVAALLAHPGATLAMSALLTTTMPAMARSIEQIRGRVPGTGIYVGGAPVTPEFSERIGADGTFPEPLKLVLAEKVAEALSTPFPAFTPRTIHGAVEIEGRATAILGMRRSGKTTFLHQVRQERVQRGAGRELVPYLNFGDERLADLDGAHLDFLARHPDGSMDLIQVCADASDPGTAEREVRALVEARSMFPPARCLLLSATQDGLPVDLPPGIEAGPAYEWML